MKSCRRVPIATTTSASAASAFAELEPITPSGPAFIGCSCTSTLRPAMVSTTGTLRRCAKAASSAAASEYSTPPPATMSGRCACASSSGGRLHLGLVRARAADAVQRRLEECRRIIEGLALGVLRQPEKGRPAIGGIQHGRDRLRQRLQDLLGPHDAVPVARDRLERVVDRGGGRIEVLHLLQDRIGEAVGERVCPTGGAPAAGSSAPPPPPSPYWWRPARSSWWRP